MLSIKDPFQTLGTQTDEGVENIFNSNGNQSWSSKIDFKNDCYKKQGRHCIQIKTLTEDFTIITYKVNKKHPNMWQILTAIKEEGY